MKVASLSISCNSNWLQCPLAPMPSVNKILRNSNHLQDNFVVGSHILCTEKSLPPIDSDSFDGTCKLCVIRSEVTINQNTDWPGERGYVYLLPLLQSDASSTTMLPSTARTQNFFCFISNINL